MLEHILKSWNLSIIIILEYPNMSYYFLDKYVSKINYEEVFENINDYKDIIPFMKKHFKMKYFKDVYLLFAGLNGHLKVVKILVEKGANVHIKKNESIKSAISNGHLKVSKFLLENGVKVCAQHDYVLILASAEGYIEVLKFLLRKGANVHSQHYSILRWACGNCKVSKVLLENGADVHAANDQAIKFAKKNEHWKVVKILKIYF